MALIITFEVDGEVFQLPIGNEFRYKHRIMRAQLILTAAKTSPNDEFPMLYGETLSGQEIEISADEALEECDVFELMDAPGAFSATQVVYASSNDRYLSGKTISY